MSRRRRPEAYSSAFSRAVEVEFGADGRLGRDDEALLRRWLADLEALARANFPDLSAVPPAQLEPVLMGLGFGTRGRGRRRLTAKEDRAREVLLRLPDLRRAIEATDAVAAAKMGLHLGALAGQLHMTPILDMGAAASERGRRRAKKRWGPTAAERAERDRRWLDRNRQLLRSVPSELERCRLIADESKSRNELGASKSNVRRVLRRG